MSHRRHIQALPRKWDWWFDQGNASSVVDEGGKIRITPYTYTLTPTWVWFAVRSDRLAGSTPHFVIAKASRYGGVPTTGENMAVWSASPDTDTWYKFDNQSIGVSDIEFYNNGPFPNGTIYISYAPMYPWSRHVRVFLEWLKDSRVTPNIYGQDTRRPNRDGRSTPALPFHGLKVTNASGYTKKYMLLSASNHPNEVEGPFQMEGAISWLLGGSLEAEMLLDYFDILVYPCVCPTGVVAGYTRSNPEHYDVWHGDFETPPTYAEYDDINAMKADMVSETGTDIEVGIDFHASVGNSPGYMNSRDHTTTLNARLLALVQSYFPSMEYVDEVYGFLLTDVWLDTYSAALSVVFEGTSLPSNGISTWRNAGQYVMQSLSTMLREGRFACGPGVGSRDFNGSTDRIDWANVFNTTAASSVSLWFYADTIATPARYLFCAHNSADTGFATIFGLGYTDASNSYIFMNAAGGTALQHSSTARATSSLSGAWHHLLYTWDGSTTAANAKIYLDGSEVAYNANINGATLTAASGSWSLGGRIYDDARNFDGHIAQVGVWDRVLTAGEIASLAAGQAPDLAAASDLQFYFKGNTSSLVASPGGTGTADGTTSVTGVGNGPTITYG